MLTTTCKANLSQVFGLYPDPANEVQDLLDKAVGGLTPLEATDHLGVVHRLWPVTDVAVDRRRRRPCWDPSRCSSPTGITATRPPATTASTVDDSGALRPSIRPISC